MTKDFIWLTNYLLWVQQAVILYCLGGINYLLQLTTALKSGKIIQKDLQRGSQQVQHKSTPCLRKLW